MQQRGAPYRNVRRALRAPGVLLLGLAVLCLGVRGPAPSAEESGWKGEVKIVPTVKEESEMTAVEDDSDRLARALELAKEARGRAYTPYSGFKMGAVVGTDRGILVPGALVENVSLGLAMCAERVALLSTVALDAGRPNLLVLVSPRTDGKLTFPCGACLQVAQELGGPDLHVEACDTKGTCQGMKLRDLAPHLPRKD